MFAYKYRSIHVKQAIKKIYYFKFYYFVYFENLINRNLIFKIIAIVSGDISHLSSNLRKCTKKKLAVYQSSSHLLTIS